MPYFTHNTPLVAGTTVRAAPLNTIFQGIQASFALLPTEEASEKGFASTVFIQDGTTADHAVNRRQLQTWPTFSSALVNLGANRLSNALDPVGAQDLTTKTWVETNAVSAIAAGQAAAISETNAAASAAGALVSETNAAASALFYNDVANHFYRSH